MGEAELIPHIAYHGTEADAFGNLANAAIDTFAVPVMGTILGSGAHSSPPAPFAPVPPPLQGEGFEGVLTPASSPVHSVFHAPVRPDQHLDYLLAQWPRLVPLRFIAFLFQLAHFLPWHQFI